MAAISMETNRGKNYLHQEYCSIKHLSQYNVAQLPQSPKGQDKSYFNITENNIIYATQHW